MPLYLLLILCLFLLSLFVPVIDVQSLWLFDDQVSIVLALKVLLTSHAYFIFILVLLFSIIFPLLKLVLMLILCFSVKVYSSWQQRLLWWMTEVSKWSMLDVFVLALSIVIIKLHLMSDAKPLLGIYLFTLAILLMSLASHRLQRQMLKQQLRYQRKSYR